MPKTAPVPRQPQDKPAQPSKLNLKQQRFVAEYLTDLNAGAAYIRAGYSARTAETCGPRLLRNAQIAAAVALGHAKQIAGVEATRERIVKEYASLAFIDGRSFYNPDGTLKAIADMSPEQGACLSSFEVIKKNAAAGDGVTDTVHKFRLWDKPKALDSLAKIMGYLDNVVQHKGEIKIIHELPA